MNITANMNIKRKINKACSHRPRHFNNNNVEKCSEWQDQVSIKSASYDRLIISTAKQLFACLLIGVVFACGVRWDARWRLPLPFCYRSRRKERRL